ncbi:MAG: PIN domain-containing protein [Pseudomonadales bacterium]|nr:PIN domain-containing protein [Pseudomonadales bacterium]
MIYLDTSVVLAYLFAEKRQPPNHLWRETLVSSRLLTYEMWTAIHARGLVDTHGESARSMIGQVALLELTPNVLAWLIDAMPSRMTLRTLDEIHLATCIYLSNQGQSIALASYDLRMTNAATTLKIPLFEL